MYRVSKMIGMVGYVLLLCEVMGMGPLFRLILPRDIAIDLVWYGVYFGVLGRDCAEVASDRMVSASMEPTSVCRSWPCILNHASESILCMPSHAFNPPCRPERKKHTVCQHAQGAVLCHGCYSFHYGTPGHWHWTLSPLLCLALLNLSAYPRTMIKTTVWFQIRKCMPPGDQLWMHEHIA